MFTNKVVIITGGTSGIGKALATAFAVNHANVVITGRQIHKLHQTVNEIKHLGFEVTPFQGDVSKFSDCEAMAQLALDKFGTIDVLVNNAGISMRAIFEELNLEVIKQLMDINFYGTVYATKVCLPHLLKSKGSVVGISSIAGYRGLPGRTGYSASKFAMNGFLEALRTETMSQGLHVLMVAPGFTASNIRRNALVADGSAQGETPRAEEKMMPAEAVADLVLKAIIKRKRDLFCSAQGRMTKMLNCLWPSFMDRMVYQTMKREPNSPIK
jgi:short-subunit dehydrogenase